MKRITILIALISLVLLPAVCQVPQKFNYQAAVRNTDGTIVASQEVELMISLLKTSPEGDVVYQETHEKETNSQGIVSLAVGGGTVAQGAFAEVPWSEGIFIKVEVKLSGQSSFVTMGVSQILSVPYAMHAGNAIQGDASLGHTVRHDGSMWAATNRVSISENTVEVIADPDHKEDEPIFAVRNSAGDIVFAVYESGTRVYIDDSGDAKGRRSGFAVGGLSDQNKGDAVNFFEIVPDFVQFNILENQEEGSKGRRSGFTVGGLSDQTKTLELTHNYFTLKPDSVRFTLVERPEKGRRSGFAVGGLSDQTKGDMDFLYVDGETTNIRNTLRALGNVTIQGDMVYGGSISTAPIEDDEGNVYQTVRIGNQLWAKQNSKYVGELVSDIDYVHYENNPDNAEIYGNLYTSVPVINPLSGVCPDGWRVPLESDWKELFTFIGGVGWEVLNQGHVLLSLMSVGDLWVEPFDVPTNSTGFSARPGGMGEYYLPDWSFFGEGDFANYWAIGLDGEGNLTPMAVEMDGTNGSINITDPQLGEMDPAYSIRCIRIREDID